MNADRVIRSLDILQTQLGAILDDTAASVLQKARRDVEFTKEQYDRYRGRTGFHHFILDTGWGFQIKDRPLRFRETRIKDYRCYVDLICDFRWKEGIAIPFRRNLVMRIWALDPDMMYREHLDARAIGEMVTSGDLSARLMMRYHFDLANEGTTEVKDHLQVGGVDDDDTYCWLHPQIDVPRFPYPPSDIFLLSELIGANFFRTQYERIRTDSTWVWQIRESQQALLQSYFEGCLNAIRDGRSLLLDYLWQS